MIWKGVSRGDGFGLNLAAGISMGVSPRESFGQKSTDFS